MAKDTRKIKEIRHGRRIASRAEEIWGWNTPAGLARAARRAELLLQAARPLRGHRILELGCGTGFFTAAFARAGLRVVACDISEEFLRIAQKKVSEALVVLADVEALPFRDSSYTAVVGSSILHHISQPAALGEVWRVLRPGGRFAFAEPNMLNPQIAVQKNIPVVKQWLGDTPDETALIPWKIRKQAGSLGFVDVSVKPHDFLHPFTPSRLIGAVKRLGAFLERVRPINYLAGSLLVTGRRPD